LAWSNPVTYQIGSNVNPTNSYTLNLQSGVPSGKPGINFIAIPFLSPWYVYKADGITPINVSGDSNELTTARNLVDAINANAGPTKNGAGIVKSFGRWEPTAQEDRGIMITYQIGGTMVQTPVKVGDSLENISLAPGVGFQVYVSAPTTIVIKNKQIE
jgi:hypothetical protein